MSTLPPECQQLLISGYVLGNLSPKEALLFEEMLAENPALIEQVASMQQAWEVMYETTEVSPPPALRDRILATATAEQTNLETVKTSENQESVTSSKFKLSLSQIFGAIALAIITTLGIANYRLWQTVQIAQTSSNQGDQVTTYTLSSADSSNNSTAKLIVDPDQLNATFMANNLPLLPPEKAYALWTVVGKNVPYTTDKKGAILTAVFQVDQSGNFTQEIAVPQPHLEPKTIKKMAISVEDVLTPQAHQGSIFIATQD